MTSLGRGKESTGSRKFEGTRATKVFTDMNAIKAVWKNGRIQPVEPIEWPEGMELVVEPFMPLIDKVGLDESEWPDDAESLADWVAWIRTVEPSVLSDEERASFVR